MAASRVGQTGMAGSRAAVMQGKWRGAAIERCKRDECVSVCCCKDVTQEFEPRARRKGRGGCTCLPEVDCGVYGTVHHWVFEPPGTAVCCYFCHPTARLRLQAVQCLPDLLSASKLVGCAANATRNRIGPATGHETRGRTALSRASVQFPS